MFHWFCAIVWPYHRLYSLEVWLKCDQSFLRDNGEKTYWKQLERLYRDIISREFGEHENTHPTVNLCHHLCWEIIHMGHSVKQMKYIFTLVYPTVDLIFFKCIQVSTILPRHIYLTLAYGLEDKLWLISTLANNLN